MKLAKRLVRRLLAERGYDIIPKQRLRELLTAETVASRVYANPLQSTLSTANSATTASEAQATDIADTALIAAADTAPAEEEYDHQAASRHYHETTGLADMDQAFVPIYERCRRFSMTSPDRMYSLFKAIEYIEAAKIPGDIVECGVWRGGSMMVAAHALNHFGGSRTMHLFDTYEGLPLPTDEDVDVWGNDAKSWWQTKKFSNEASDWARSQLDEVQANMRSTGYPDDKVRYIKGMVERTIPEHAPAQISLLRLDTDWYASTVHEMEHLFPRLVPNGVLIIDDYGHFKGAKQAVDEYLAKHKIPIMLVRVDYTGRVAIKTHG